VADQSSKLQPAFEPPELPRFWRTLEERDAPASAGEAREFEPDVLNPELPTNVVSRRGFLGIFGATAALATAACTNHDRTIVPYTKRPPEVIPGVANYYATTFPEGRRSYAVLVKAREGRPIHVTGNDEHPRCKGKTSPRAIADVAALYDPDRVRSPRLDERPTTWGEATKALTTALAAAKRDGSSVLLLTGASDSPSRNALLAQLKANVPTLDVVQWEPAESDSARLGSKAAFGDAFELCPKFSEADVIVALGADFLNGEDPVAISEFAAKRRPDRPGVAMNRLWVFEGPLSLTGANADERVPIRPSQIPLLAWALVRDLHTKGGVALPAGVNLPAIPEDIVQKLGVSANHWNHLLADLARARRAALVLCGAEIAAEGHVAAHVLNAMLQSAATESRPAPTLASLADIQKLVGALNAGRYSAAIVWNVNPVYAYPQSDQWTAAFSKVGARFWLGCLPDETTPQCKWVLPSHHWLESWGDYGSGDLLTLQQPVIAPLYDTRQPEDLLISVLKELGATAPADYRTYVRERWNREVKPVDALVPFDHIFNAALHDGLVIRAPDANAAALAIQPAAVNQAANAVLSNTETGGFELVLKPGTQVYDGRYANNGWLQELPDPITKSTWGNPLLLGPEDARELGLSNGDIAVLEVGGKSLRTPIIVQPGQSKGVLSLALGYGRATGAVARGVGVNGFPLLAVDSPTPQLRLGAKLTNAHARVRLPMTQAHHRMEGRDLVRSFSPEQYAAEVKQPRRKLEIVSLYPDQKFPEHKWGMSIDLSACVGCAACALACQSENNVATVGPEQVERGREMHWIRIDSYYEGSETNPRVVHQPMLCQHCDDAPCENVCPVNATNHSSDGLNQMVYNRCVGTRYCANNCPYKVRRFNFFEYTAEKKEPADLVYNPEVTVRPRGVMEKCTFCVQRIEDGRMRAKTEHRSVRDGDITPACAAACPSGAIVFGDLRDPQSRVANLQKHSRAYKVLDELGTRPAVTYLADLKNPAVSGGTDE
jgi:molybdopterin-containing oxidoreductase family iron-sulfur binding subunit